MNVPHTPVLVSEAVEALKPKSSGFYVDGTIGLGGHAAAILQACPPNGRLLGIDLDAAALAIARERLREYEGRLTLAQGNFADLDQILEKHTHQPKADAKVDGILLDLGVSSLQLDTPDRGFSFTHAGPLDMRMSRSQSLSAAQVVNQSTESELAHIFTRFGEERWSRRIAHRVVQARKVQPISTTLQLAEVVLQAIPQKATRGRIHPATRVFQALRIYVNNELKNLHAGIDCAVSTLKPDGRICVISFHSLEDRIVKERFRALSRACICPPKTPICVCHHTPSLQILTKRPITPKPDEIRQNPRSRSAKLRAAVRIGES
ncbi:MAG: 16S rRNA (cytosine(1402)-N(4))-methyltransferase RsmH [Candidatus Poribacteria bacterium]|nr:16S rRNA (cytosine(1402)-N(4))-methyltransferase RsmH [Candidatus Poribacteria bacterium]